MSELSTQFNCDKLKELAPKGDRDFRREYIDFEKETNVFSFPPLKPEKTRLAGVVTERPEDPEPIIQFNDGTLFIRKVVGSLLAAGGTGKTMLFTRLAVMSAIRGVSSFWPFKASIIWFEA